MKIFIKDIPVIIISNQEFVKTSNYDNIYKGEKLKLDQLSGEVLVKDATTKVIDDFLVFLKQNSIKKL